MIALAPNSRRLPRIRLWRAVALLIAIIAFTSGAPRAIGTSYTPLGYQMHLLGPYMRTRALVVARLIEVRTDPVEAYVVFEVLRVVRGEEPATHLLFPYPDRQNIIEHVPHTDVKTLQEGKSFLLRLMIGDAALRQWIPLSGPDDQEVINKELAAHEEVDRLRPTDPWKAVNSKDLRTRAYAMIHYGGVPADEKAVLFEEYLKRADPTSEDTELIDHLINTPFHRKVVSNDMLLKLAQLPVASADGARTGRRVILREHAIELGAMAAGPAWDRVVVTALDEYEPYWGIGAAGIIMGKRKVSGSVPVLRKIIEKRDANPKKTESDARFVMLLAKQGGPDVAEDVVRLARLTMTRNNAQFLFVALIACGQGARIPQFRNQLLPGEYETLVASLASQLNEIDPQVIQALKLTSSGNNYIRPPYLKNAPDRRVSDVWQPIARSMLKQDVLADGGAFVNAAEILFQLRDEQLPDLLVGQVDHRYWSEYALEYLAMTASQKHRPVLTRFAKHDDSKLRAYALAGLARLGDRDAMRDVARIAFLGRDSYARYLVTSNVLARIDRAPLIQAWEYERPADGDTIGGLRHDYVLRKLSGPLSGEYGMDAVPSTWPSADAKTESRLRIVLLACLGGLILLCAILLIRRIHARPKN